MDLLEIKDILKRIYSRHGIVIDGAVKFIFSLTALLMINSYMGAMTVLKNPAVVLMVSLICAVVPKNLMVLILALFIVAHGYGISLEMAVFLLVVLLVMFLFYFRLSPGDGFVLILMPVLFALKIPFVLPIALGLAATPFSMVSLAFGTILYFIIYEINERMDKLLLVTADGLENMTEVAKAVFTNQAMYAVIVIFALMLTATFVIRKLSVSYSWLIAAGAGTVIGLAVMLFGGREFGITQIWSVPVIILGSLAAAAEGALQTLLLHHVDYKRTEKVQFEDDDYYYYVKAVPKITAKSRKRKKRTRA